MLNAVRRYFRPEDDAPREWHTQCALTPDIWKLEQFMFQLIFVCDDMMRDHRNNSMIADAATNGDTPVHPTCYTSSKHTFWKKDLGGHSFPIPLPFDYTPTGFIRWKPEPARIKGQLYAIRPNQFILLDKHRQNGIQFRRIRVTVLLPYRTVRYTNESPISKIPTISNDYVSSTTAWMYVGIPEYWDNQIGGIFQSAQVEPREHLTKKVWIDKFYQFEK